MSPLWTYVICLTAAAFYVFVLNKRDRCSAVLIRSSVRLMLWSMSSRRLERELRVNSACREIRARGDDYML